MMKSNELSECRYKLAPGVQVREEGFGLLFYSKEGPRLYFLSSGDMLRGDFFQGSLTLRDWVNNDGSPGWTQNEQVVVVENALRKLKEKGVIIEC